jgi:hypothetical protein
MNLASEIVQDFLAKFLKIEEFSCKANFSVDFKILNEDILEKIKESNLLKTHFASNIS